MERMLWACRARHVMVVIQLHEKPATMRRRSNVLSDSRTLSHGFLINGSETANQPAPIRNRPMHYLQRKVGNSFDSSIPATCASFQKLVPGRVVMMWRP